MISSLILLAIVYWGFSFRTINRKVKKQGKKVLDKIAATAYEAIPVETQTNKFQWQTFLSLVKIEISAIIKSLPFLIVIVLWIMIGGSEIFNAVSETARSPAFYPLTGKIVSYIMDAIPFFGIMVLIFYSNEQIWRNHSIQFDEIANTTPASNGVFYLSKYCTLAIMPFLPKN